VFAFARGDRTRGNDEAGPIADKNSAGQP